MFLPTKLKDGRQIAIALANVENIYADSTGDAVFVMLPSAAGQRTFETGQSYDSVLKRIERLRS